MQVFNRSILGDFALLDIGTKFRADVLSQNIIRINDGAVVVQGVYAITPNDEYDDIFIPTVAVGYQRIDTIYLHYIKDSVNDTETFEIDVEHGEEVIDYPVPPTITPGGDIWDGATDVRVPIYDVLVTSFGLTVTPYERMETTSVTIEELKEMIDDIDIPSDLVQRVVALERDKADKSDLFTEIEGNTISYASKIQAIEASTEYVLTDDITAYNYGLEYDNITGDVFTCRDTTYNWVFDLYVLAYEDDHDNTHIYTTNDLRTDFRNWTEVTTISNKVLKAITYTGSGSSDISYPRNYVACGDTFMYSYDLINWTDTGISASVEYIYYNDGVLFGLGNGVWYSLDVGITWTKISNMSTSNHTFGGGALAIVNDNKLYVTFTDKAWLTNADNKFVEYTLPESGGYITYGNGLYCYNTQNCTYYSKDGGASWTQIDYFIIDGTPDNQFSDREIFFGRGIFICNYGYAVISQDLINWVTIPEIDGYDVPYEIQASSDKFLVGKTGIVWYYPTVSIKKALDDKVDEISEEIEEISEDIEGAKTVSGEVITIDDAAPINAQSVIVDIEPYQEGSGDPSPNNERPIHGWNECKISGVGKNLLPMTIDSLKAANTDGTWSGNVYTYNGVTYTILTDSDSNIIGIQVNGTGTGDSHLTLVNWGTWLTSGKNYILNGTPSGGSSSTYFLFVGTYSPGESQYNYRDYGSGVTIPTEDNIVCRIYGISASNVIIRPMIRLATETDPTFEPYLGTDYTIDFGETIYGAKYNATKGELVVEKAIVDLGSLEWQTRYTGATNKTISAQTGLVYKSYESDFIFEQYEYKGSIGGVAELSQPDLLEVGVRSYYPTDENIIYLVIPNSINPNGKAIIKLATPYTIKLTPQQIKLLENTNTLYANCGDITLTYQPNNALGKALEVAEVGYDAQIEYIKNNYMPISEIAPVENGDTASTSYAVDDYLCRGNKLYKVISAIAQGATFTTSNIQETTVMAEILSRL